jgi:hypothetical protein
MTTSRWSSGAYETATGSDRRELMRRVRWLLLSATLAVPQLACDRRPAPAARDSTHAQTTTVPAYLAPLFHSIDSLLPGQLRDSLRNLSLDSAYTFRMWRLAEAVKPLEAGWIRSPIGDSILAHGEKAYMTGTIVLDLYQQHLRGEALDLAGALRRVSPAYVERIRPQTISVDSVLLERDLDDNNVPDQLVREARRFPIEAGHPGRDSVAEEDAVSYAEHRLALYLNAPPSTSQAPTWFASFDDISDGQLIRTIARSGGTLLVLGIGGGDAYETVILLVRLGQAREILHHQIDYGEGAFDVSDQDGRVTVVVTGTVELGGREVKPTIACPREAWAGSRLLYDDTAKQFVVEQSICVPRS